MDLGRSGTARERAAHYRDNAARLRQMAAAESIEHTRRALDDAAEQYEWLADRLSRGVGERN